MTDCMVPKELGFETFGTDGRRKRAAGGGVSQFPLADLFLQLSF